MSRFHACCRLKAPLLDRTLLSGQEMSEKRRKEEQNVRPSGTATTSGREFGSLQVILWSTWTIAVLARSYLYVRPALLAHEPVDLAGLVIHCLLAGMLGMVAITIIEMQLEPWRFLDDRDA